jgi:adenylate cyclase
VNIASRLEGLTKEYGVGILASENIVKAAQGFVYREVDLVAVKGRAAGIPIFEPVGKVGEVGDTTLAEIDRFHKALEWFRAQRWNEAEEAMKTLRFAAPDNKLYKLYLTRIAEYRANPPGPGWNGLWVWTTK